MNPVHWARECRVIVSLGCIALNAGKSISIRHHNLRAGTLARQITGNARKMRFNSDGSSGQQESAAERDHRNSRPVRFDAEAAAWPFRLQRVTPGAKPPSAAESASPDGLKRHLENAAENEEHAKPYESHAHLLYPRTPTHCCAEKLGAASACPLLSESDRLDDRRTRQRAARKPGIAATEAQVTSKRPA
ncbi:MULTISPECIES: hypothetical protein [Bradyrhizobium]|uniref:Uncharacterized protein n=1 Tax=Bradyrhizobium vignae TaxID=1549949 RepID=A0ABS3ZTL0_9BRAD|nr:hypothetical protein [Bradyrhizobium vignae]MBP0111498.1 hypothetical protein [Bradyrhizobium vignae]